MSFGNTGADGSNGRSGVASTYPAEEVQSRIHGFDWSTTPLGPMDQWPQSLRSVVNILLSSRYAMWMAWGPELTMLYNDAYRPTLGIKHPWALGQEAREVWAEIWPDIGPRIESVLTTGKATYDEGLLLFLERSGFPEETYHTFSYSPLLNDEGQMSGMLCVVTEETDRLIGERRVETLREVASALASAKSEEEVLRALTEQLSLNRKDLPFTLLYLFDDRGGARLACTSGITNSHPLAPAWIEPGSDFPWPANQVRHHPAARLMGDLSRQRNVGELPTGDWSKAVEQVAIVPIRQQGQEQPAGIFVVGTNPYRRYDIAYSGFVSLLVGQIAAGLGNAWAYEAERQRAEALAEIDKAKTTFFSNVSHELRTPLTLMLGPVEELLGGVHAQPGTDERELLTLVHRNGLRLQKLVNTLLDFSRIEAGRMQARYEATDLGHCTMELAANFRSAMERAGLEFTVACEDLGEPVYVDREMWEKVVLNLLSNALKFTFEGGVHVSLRRVQGQAQLTVQDTGAGIPAADLPLIFERFRRVAGTKGRTIEGTGIGLALVQELVRLHGGTIIAESEIAEGSTFTVTIPFGNAHLPKHESASTAASIKTSPRADAYIEEALRWLPQGDVAAPWDEMANLVGGATGLAATGTRWERILLADDNADMREYVARLLGGTYQVTTVANGEEALQSALADPPDLILSDVMMPGLDGFGLLRELRSRPETNTIPVLLLSARAGEESRVEGLGAGADDYLVKPFTARELTARVAAHLSMRQRIKEAAEASSTIQATLQSFYDSSPFLMGVVELDGDQVTVVHFNRATERFFCEDEPFSGDPRREGEGIRPNIAAHWLDHYRQCQTENRYVHFEYEHRSRGADCCLSATVNCLGLGPTGHPRFSFIADDITERRKNEELVRSSNAELRRANADLEQFAYSASHDLKEPLRQIAVYSQLLEKKYTAKLDGKASEYLGYCVEGAHRMDTMISGLLAYTQAAKTTDLSAGRVSIADVIQAVRENLATTIEEAGGEILTSELPVVVGDPVPLVQLFQNLVSNAMKYRTTVRPLVRISAVEEAGRWRFAVQDNGIGIPSEFQTQIFGIFKRLHGRDEYDGTGIGLAICQRIVERYGGRIWVESVPGQGSTFFFTLPRDEHDQ